MLKIKKISEVLGKQAFTSDGDFLGVIEEANLVENRLSYTKCIEPSQSKYQYTKLLLSLLPPND
jgi:sporulation protein YlmC with PRC-barrel domain